MAWNENPYGREQLVGNVDLPLVAQPTIRGTKRRHDPDITHAETYFLGLTATTLELELSGVGGTTIVTFLTDDYQDALDAINAALPSDIIASDDDGCLRLTHRQAGGTHFLKIVSGDACPLLGFEVFPIPGSISFAGELATASPGVKQQNPQGTALHSHGETYSSAVMNRIVYGSLLKAERYLKGYEKDILQVVEVPVTVSLHPISSRSVFYITDEDLRLCQGYRHFGIGTSNPSAVLIEPIACILDTNKADIYVTGARGQGPAGVGTPGTKVRVDAILYGDATTPLNPALTFTAWGTPDGKSIFGPFVYQGTKVGLFASGVAITETRGNLIEAPGANFLTNRVKAGDTVQISFTAATSPFLGAGEYIVEEVFTEDVISVRGKDASEPTVGSFTGKPTKLNPAALGQISIFIGDYIPAHSLAFRINETIPNGSYIARLLVGRRYRSTSLTEQATRDIAGSRDRISLELWDHINRTAPDSDAHPATAISTTALPTWADGDTLPGDDLQAQLGKMVTDLASTVDAVSGTHHVGAGQIAGGFSAGDTTPFTLAAGPAITQLQKLLFLLNGHVTGLNQHHQASVIDYAGGPIVPDGSLGNGNWQILATSLESALDQLMGHNGLLTPNGAGLSHPNQGVGWLYKQSNRWAGQQRHTGERLSSDEMAHQTFEVGAASRKLVSEGLAYTSGVKWRLYSVNFSGKAGLEITTNAYWTTSDSKWNKDLTLRATIIRILFDRFEIAHHTTGLSKWDDTAWTRSEDLINWASADTSTRTFNSNNHLIQGLLSTYKQIIAGTGLLGASLGADTARFLAQRDGGAERTLIFEFPDPGSGQHFRVYRSNYDTEGLEIAINCYWTEDTGSPFFIPIQLWNTDTVSNTPTLIQFSRLQMRVLRRSSGTPPSGPPAGFTHDATGWDDGFPSFAIDYRRNNEPHNSTLINTFTSKSIAKAWGRVQAIIRSGSPVVEILDGQNLSGLVQIISNDRVRIFFAGDMADDEYGVLVTMNVPKNADVIGAGKDFNGDTVTAVTPFVLAIETDHIDVMFHNVNSSSAVLNAAKLPGAPSDPNNVSFTFEVKGLQDS
jgi:hypothetical protein